MQVYVLKTDGGAHPPEKWAFATATHLVSVSPNADSLKQRDAFLVQMDVAHALEPHHTTVQNTERGNLAAAGDAHLAIPLDPTPHVEEALAAVLAVLHGSAWEKRFEEQDRRADAEAGVPSGLPHYSRPNVLAEMRSVLANHFATSMHIERSWHVDRNPSGPNAQAFRAAHHPGPPPAAAAAQKVT